MALTSSLALRVGSRVGLSVHHVWFRQLDKPTPMGIAPRFEVRILERAEALAHASDPALDLDRDFVDSAFAQGSGCLGAFEHGRLAGYAWYSYTDTELVPGVMVRVPPHAIYRYKSFVRPECRGGRLAPKMYVEGARLIRKPGRDYSFALVSTGNWRSAAASEAAGRARLGTIVLLAKPFVTLASRGPRRFGTGLYRRARR